MRDVSFDLRHTERLGIVGESGSGKSALALSILGLIEPPGRVVGGEILLCGRDISKLTDRQLGAVRGKEIALVLQDPSTALDPVKTIGSQIVEALAAHDPDAAPRGRPRTAAELLRERRHLPGRAAPRRLSPPSTRGGMRQRVAIAIAIAYNPRVLIADEPTTALDVTTQAQVLGLLDRLVEEHRTAVILITHNLGIVSEFLRLGGRHVRRALRRDLRGRARLPAPTHPYSEALLKCVPNPERLAQGPLPAISGFPPTSPSCPPAAPSRRAVPVGRISPSATGRRRRGTASRPCRRGSGRVPLRRDSGSPR